MLVRYGRNFFRVYFEAGGSASKSFCTSQTRDPENWTTPGCVFEGRFKIFLASLGSQAKQVFPEHSAEFASKKILGNIRERRFWLKKNTTAHFPFVEETMAA